jgi:hypothetical protein
MASTALVLVNHLHAAPPASQSDRAERPVLKTMEATPEMYLRYVDVTINLAHAGPWMLLDKDGELYATAEILQQWRLVVPAGLDTVDFSGA